MEPNDRNRRRPAGRKAPADRPRRPAPPRRPAAQRPEPPQTQRRRATGSAAVNRRRRNPEQMTRRNRVVRAPDHNIPEVTYTMPKPFSRGGFLLKIVTVVAVVGAFLACLSLFFKVDSVKVVGAEKYSPYMIKEASGIEIGDSLLGLSEPRAAGRIIDALPYVRDVKIGRTLPGTVNIQIRELDVTYAIEAIDGTWWLIASDGRVIDQIDSTAATGYTRLLGVRAEAPRINQQIQAFSAAPVPEIPVATEDGSEATEATDAGLMLPTQPQITDADRLRVALELLTLLEQNEVIGDMASIDVSSLTNITMEYSTRFHVVVGTTENLSYKIAAMVSAIDQLEEYEIGELDVSFKFSEKVIFNPAS